MCTVRSLCGAIALLTLFSACTPALTPLYQDYAIPAGGSLPDEDGGDRAEHIRQALTDAGWVIADSALAPAVATEPRTHRNWGIYRVTVELEAVPMGERHVRILIHPYREYVWGRRSKLPYLTATLRRAIMPDLHRSFAARGLVARRIE